MRSFRGKKVFITGGSSGIGKAVALQLAAAGAHVTIAARRKAQLDETIAELEAVGDGGRFHAVQLDVSDREAVRASTDAIIENMGGLDVLINNAGITHPGYIMDIDDDVFDSMMNVNYFGTLNVTRAFLPHFVKQRSGHICNVSSLLGFMGIFGYSAYAASKFAITGLSDCLRQELLPYNVSVSVAFPPDTDTPQYHQENRIKPPETKAIAGNVKVLPPEHVAKAILDGIAGGKYHIVMGFDTKFTYFMYRHFPQVVRWKIDSDLKRYRKDA